MLTAKEEKFAQCIALEDMNYTEAYKAAYNTSRMSDKTVNEKASLLKDKDKIRTRVDELRKEAATPKVMSAQKRREWLTEVINDPEVDINVKLKASDQLNRMTGEYVQKVEAAVTNAVNINIELSED